MTRTVVLVSTPIKPDLAEAIAAGEAPRRDYFELRDMLRAELMAPPEKPGRLYSLLRKAGGNSLAMAVTAWLRRDSYDVILTDQESVGLLLAMLFKLTLTRRGHVMISHYLTPFKKQVFYRWFGAQARIDRTVCYSSAQAALARTQLGLRDEQVALVLHPADASFWCPPASDEEREADETLLREASVDLPSDVPLICSAGLEFRDYPTLVEAAKSLPAGTQVVIAASSPWSKRKDATRDTELPENVRRVSLKPLQLRALYRRAGVVAIPLHDVDFQAGSLVAYEAMACGRPVVITRTRGQRDIVREGETGFYVPAGDPSAMAGALNRLLGDPSLAEKMGRFAREVVVEHGLNLDSYLVHMVDLVHEAARRAERRSTARRTTATRRG